MLEKRKTRKPKQIFSPFSLAILLCRTSLIGYEDEFLPLLLLFPKVLTVSADSFRPAATAFHQVTEVFLAPAGQKTTLCHSTREKLIQTTTQCKPHSGRGWSEVSGSAP